MSSSTARQPTAITSCWALAVLFLTNVFNQGELVLDTTRFEPWEIAAQLHIRLAYPGASAARTQNLINSVCADQIAVQIEHYPEHQAQLLARYPAYNPRMTYATLMAMFRVSRSTVYRAIRGQPRGYAPLSGQRLVTATQSRPMNQL